MTNLEDNSNDGLLDLSSSEQKVPIMEFETEAEIGLTISNEALQNSNAAEMEDSSLSSSNTSNTIRHRVMLKKSYSKAFQEKLLAKIIAANKKAEEYEKQTIELQKVQLALQEKSVILESELINEFKEMLDQQQNKKQKTDDQEGQTELLKQQLLLQHKSIALQEQLLSAFKEFAKKQS